MAANSACRAEIQSVDGVEFLARMLETKATDEGTLSPAELAAAERVQKKAAIALSRLLGSNDSAASSACASELLRLGGLSRLVELCKEPMERNYSDAVLVACLAVLRRLRSNAVDVSRLLDETGLSHQTGPATVADSFLEHSAKQESYV